jgi:hypothetical protein
MNHAGVRDFGAIESQRFQIGEVFDSSQAAVSDTGARNQVDQD